MSGGIDADIFVGQEKKPNYDLVTVSRIAPVKRFGAPDYVAVHLFLALSYAKLDRMEEARAQMNEVLRINPKFSIEAYVRYAGGNIRYRGWLDRDAEIMARIGFPAQSRK